MKESWLSRLFGEKSRLPSFKNLPSLKTEKDVIGHAFDIKDWIRQHFQNNNFFLAEACQDFLMDAKCWEDADKTILLKRKDGETPEFMHEHRPIMSIFSFQKEGLLPVKESVYGSMELLFCALLVHDLGEDRNVYPDELYQRLQNVVASLSGKDGLIKTREDQDRYQDMALRAARIMELMTIERDYKKSDICALLNIPEDQELTEDDLKSFVETQKKKMSCVPDLRDKLKIVRHPQKEDKYILSINIIDGIRDLNTYVSHLEEDPFAILAKFFDRNEGLSTRIWQGFDITNYARYLSVTEQLFSADYISENMKKKYPEFGKAFDCLDGMMGVLYRIGRTYVNHHEAYNLPGSKGFAISTTKPIHFRDYLPRAINGFKHVPAGLHPLNMIMERIRNVDGLGNDAKVLYDNVWNSINNVLNSQQSSSWRLSRIPVAFNLF